MSMHRWRRVGVVMGVLVVSGGCAGDGVTAPVAPAPQVLPSAGTDIVQVLQGKVEGVRVAEPGRPSGSMRIRICNVSGERMVGRPLFVVDGAVVQHTLAHGVDPAQIVSVEVLKGPRAMEIYGPEARDGAVIVRTKGGAGAGAPSDPAAR